MDIYVGNLATRTNAADLHYLFKKYAPQIRFSMHKKLLPDGELFCYATGTLVPDKRALKAIKGLHRSLLHRKIIVIREYLHRAIYNERRSRDWRDKPWQGVELRKHERRITEIELLAEKDPSIFELEAIPVYEAIGGLSLKPKQ